MLETWNFKINSKNKILEITTKADQDVATKLVKMVDTTGGHYGIILETRQKANYRIRKSNMRWGDYTVQNSGARLWNNLKTPLKSISNKKTFNCKVKENFIAAYFI